MNCVTVKQQRRKIVQTRAGVDVKVVCLGEGNTHIGGSGLPKGGGFFGSNLGAVDTSDYCQLCKKTMAKKDT
jgi:hypothetical protein